MDLTFYEQLEIRLDGMESRLQAAEKALTQLPQINFQTDPSRPEGVVVTPAALTGL